MKSSVKVGTVKKETFCSTINHTEGVKVLLELGNQKGLPFCNVVDVEKGTVWPIDPDDVVSSLISSYQKSIRVGRIPGSSFILDMAFKDSSSDKQVLTFVNPGKVNFKTADRMFKNISTPAMLFCYTLSGNPCSIRKTSIACLKGITDVDEITNSTPIYKYPLMHVSGSGFTCWGNIKLPNIDNLDHLMYIPGLFFNAEMSLTHYGESTNNTSNLPMAALLDKLESEEIFLKDILKPLDLTYIEYANKYLGVWQS